MVKEILKSNLGKNNNFFGKKHSEESKRKMRLKRIGSRHSEETKIKMSVSAMGRKKSLKERQQISTRMTSSTH